MALNQERLENKIKGILNVLREEKDDPDDSRDYFAIKLAQVIIEELKAADVVGVDSRGDTHNLKIQ